MHWSLLKSVDINWYIARIRGRCRVLDSRS